MKRKIEIIGARTNNLQSVDVDIPLSQATLIIGVSGSGKSSLLADTLATEANIRARRFLGVSQPHLTDEDVPAFIGPIPICLHFSQGAFRASSRSTVATSNGLLTILRSYFRKYAKPWIEDLKEFAPPPSADSYAGWIKNHYNGAFVVWVVLTRWERTNGLRAIERLRRNGVGSAIIRSETDTGERVEKGREVSLDKFRPLSETTKHLIEAKIGSADSRISTDNLLPLLSRAFEIGGDVVVEFAQNDYRLPRELHTERGLLLDSSEHWVHPEILLPFSPPTDALLSFNSPLGSRSGACQTCAGLGHSVSIKLDALVAHPAKSMSEGALSLWTMKNYRSVNIQHETIEGLRGIHGFAPEIPWKNLSEEAQRLILFGSGDEKVSDVDIKTRRKISSPRLFLGFIPIIIRRAAGQGTSARSLQTLIAEGLCPECTGSRWSRLARALRLGRWSLPTLLGLEFEELEKITARGNLDVGLPQEALSLAPILHHFSKAFILTGLGHLSGARGMSTLSEGESRRARLATLLRAPGTGLGLLLDEPARGLHEEDIGRLAAALTELKKRHTLVINEHRLSLSTVADKVIEIGPGGGLDGGRIINSGPPAKLFTPDWFPKIERPKLPTSANTPGITIREARLHTLDSVTCTIPLGRLISITGVSGSGKSTFVRGVLLPALAEAMPDKIESDGFAWPGGVWKSISGIKSIKSVIALEPRTPGGNRRSTIHTVLDLAEDLRMIFGKSVEAKRASLTPTDFGLNAGSGRCETCLGLGEVQDDDRWVRCPHCGGRRFGEEVLGIRVDGLNIADVLDLSITDLFEGSLPATEKWRPLLEQLIALDLGYLSLGRRIDRLSGGEYQRLRLARKLAQKQMEGVLLVLDEPSAGLHPKDVKRLLHAIDHVVREGRNTVVLVEHNLDLIRASDWIVDFGPGGGPSGGNIIGQGVPDEVAKENTPTGRALRGETRPYKTTLEKTSVSRSDELISPYRDTQRGRRSIKRLLGQEAGAEDQEPLGFEELFAEFDSNRLLRPYEIGGLDVEIARLLLDEDDYVEPQIQSMAQTWIDDPSAELQINPMVEEIRVWGEFVPTSVVGEVRKRLKHLDLESNFDTTTDGSVAKIRVTGRRFGVNKTLEEMVKGIRDAVGIGGGYVELRNKKSELQAVVQGRSINLDALAVAPLSPSSAFLVRSHPIGQCPCCEGKGSVSSFDESLVIGNPKADYAEEKFFTKEALSVFRGIRRNTFLPFFKRMAAEGLFPANEKFSEMAYRERIILLHGFWHRPGSGSFLKTPKADPAEVGSWLRWNGLFREMLAEADRSKSNEWRAKIQETIHLTNCPVCEGTGLKRYARAVFLGSKSFFELVRDSTLGELTKELRKLKLSSTRSERTRERILFCLEPANQLIPGAALRKPVTNVDLHRAVFERVVHSMTRMKVLN
jgi:excinuclease ABC A subunit